MSTIKINVRPIEAFEVTDDAGNLVAIARVTERWQGMARLVTGDGQSLIVDDPSTFAVAFGKAFSQIFGTGSESTYSLEVFKATPELLAKLGLAVRKAGAPA